MSTLPVNEFSQLFEQFIKHKIYTCKSSLITIKHYKWAFGLLLDFKPDLRLEDLREYTFIDNFNEYLDTRERKVGRETIVRKLKNTSAETIRSKLNSFFTWLKKCGQIEQNPYDGVKHADVAYTDKRAFSAEEVKALCYSVTNQIQWASLLIKKRNIAVLMFLFYTGVRKEELLALRTSDLDIKNKVVNIRSETSKVRRARNIPLSPGLIPFLEDYLQARAPFRTEFLWVSERGDRGWTEHGIKHWIDEVIRPKTGIHFTLHRCRHTFAVNYYRQTKDTVGLQKILGHKSPKQTLTYLRSFADIDIAAQMEEFSIAKFA